MDRLRTGPDEWSGEGGRSSVKRFLAMIAAATALLVLAGGLFVSPAGAAPVAPELVGPADGVDLTSNPVLIWDAAVGAARYRVQISTSDTFGSTVVNTTTYNTKYTPPADLAQTTIYWRVRSIDSANAEGDWSSTWSFVKGAANAPTPLGPADGDTLDFPDDPLVFSWQPITGAKSYELQIDSEDTFTAPLTETATTANTSWAAPDPQTMDQTFFWRVRALSPQNVPTLWSETRDYSSLWPDVPQLELPADASTPTIEEVVFQWSAVKGAQYYNLTYSPNAAFTGPNVVLVQNIRSTRFSPTTTPNNGGYWWKVQAKNGVGGLGEWSAVHTFTRSWPAPELTEPPTADPPPNCESTNDFTVVELCTPANGTLVTEPALEWTPVRLASGYQVQIGTSDIFPVLQPNVTTDHTTYTAVTSQVSAPGTYYWRVRPIDEPAAGGIPGVWSATGSFRYEPNMVAPQSPANGASVSAPILRWEGKIGDGDYEVTIKRDNGTVVDTVTVNNTAYVPQGLNPAQGPFTWSVKKVGGPDPDASLERTFSLSAPGGFPSPNPIVAGLGNVYAPVFQWSPVTSATTYTVEVDAPGGGTTWAPISGGEGLTRPAFAYSGYDLTPGVWQWRVKAFNGVTLLATGDQGSFNVLGTAFNEVDGTAIQLLSPDFCSGAPCVLNDTPRLRWNPVPGVTSYQLYFANDVNFTNVTGLPGGFGGRSMWSTSYTTPESLVDSQADQAIYWYVRPSTGKEPSSFATDPNTPVRAFRKQSSPVQLVSPANNATGAQYSNQITFTWRDYLRTNDDADPRNTQEARQYRIQVSAVADFATSIETKVVDQTTYTPFDKTYPDGPIYWRVQAIDGSENNLPWSETRLVTKSSPIPVQDAPSNGATVGAVPLLTWEPQLYAAAYDVEIYKNPTPPGQGVVPGNKVFTLTNGKITAVSPTNALPAGEYGWRIRRKDADARPGPWSAETNGDLRKFTIVPAQPSLVSPDNGANITDNNILLDWNAVAGATQFRVQTSTVSSFASTKENITTVMTEWAPTALYADGTYHWRVQSLDSAGNVLGTSETRTFVKGPPEPPGVLFNAIAPKRILDSRPGVGNVGPFTSPWNTNTTRDITVAGGTTSVPADADAVTLNVTATDTNAVSFLTLWPKGDTKPDASSLNWNPGWTVPNSVTVKVGSEGKISAFNFTGRVNVIVDVVGYYTESTGAGFTSVNPNRILDSRDGTGGFSSPWATGTERTLDVTGGLVPDDAEAVVLNVTATDTNAVSFLSIWPDGQAKPTVSSLNWDPGWTIPNAVTVKVGDGGNVKLFNNQGRVNVIADVVGYFKAGSGSEFHPLAPSRILDSRGGAMQVGPFSTPWGNNTTRNLQVVNPNVPDVPAAADAVLLNVTANATTATSFLSVYPNGTPQPTVSSLNWSAGWTIPNAVTAKVGTSGQIRIYNFTGQVHVIADLAGWYG
jgi:hypothetical protein